MTDNLILMGFRGNNFLETGAVYAPYIPLVQTPLVYDPVNFTPRRGVMTSYAKKIVRPEFYGSNLYCRFGHSIIIILNNLQQKGVVEIRLFLLLIIVYFGGDLTQVVYMFIQWCYIMEVNILILLCHINILKIGQI